MILDISTRDPSTLVCSMKSCLTKRDTGLETARLRVLLADDHHDSIAAFELLFSAWGYEVVSCEDGRDAVAEARRLLPDLAIIDINLAGLDGYEVAKRIREIPAEKRPMLIAMTGHGDPASIARSREAGFDHHLLKPVDAESLKRLLSDSQA